jgi:hypothetical protein
MSKRGPPDSASPVIKRIKSTNESYFEKILKNLQVVDKTMNNSSLMNLMN